MKIFRNIERSSMVDAEHFPLYFWEGSFSLAQQEEGFFGYVQSGTSRIKIGDIEAKLSQGCYFCGSLQELKGGSGFFLGVPQFSAMNLLGGPIEREGRLKYIDGCTDTLLIAPVKRGDPCLNALYFPSHTEQTIHTHPSVRIGMVTQGQGLCVNEKESVPLLMGDIFIIHPEEKHAFQTGKEEMTVIAFHPDSDFGPEDNYHPMINRTEVDGVSARFIEKIQTK